MEIRCRSTLATDFFLFYKVQSVIVSALRATAEGYRGKYVRPITDLKQPSEASR